jgi:hypothetical protein
MFPELTDAQIETVVEAIESVFTADRDDLAVACTDAVAIPAVRRGRDEQA